jgi:hypothetical protein
MITIVSGLPRSGTSLMMQMLEAGGLPVLTDGLRPPDQDNPRGYYEFEPVKRTRIDAAWVGQAEGRAVKVVSSLLDSLPSDRFYKVLFLRRNLSEILLSQAAMLTRLGNQAEREAGLASPSQVQPANDLDLGLAFERHLRKIEAWLATRRYMSVLYCEFAELMYEVEKAATKVARFLETDLIIPRMVAVVDRTLHRQRIP